jgi:DNA-binding transcriptional LysR family regulator
VPAPTSDLSLTHLRCFLAVLDAGSFAEAGRQLGLSTSAVSKIIGRFEASYGVKLLHRSTHALSLTEDGARLLDPAREAVGAIASFEDTLRSLATDGVTGWVRISAPVAFTRHCLVPLLAPFREAHPEIRLDLRASNRLVDLADKGIDLALRGGSLDGIPGHLHQPWFTVPWVLCATPTYVARRGMPESPSDLPRHDMIGFRNPQTGIVHQWRFRDPASAEQVRFTLEPRLVFDDAETACQAAAVGLGIAHVPHYVVADAIASDAIVELLGAWRDANTTMSIVRRDTKLTPPRVGKVIAFLKSQAARFDCPER